MNKPNLFSGCDIRIVCNGYQIIPCGDPDKSPCARYDDIRVFESFESLTDWLKENLEDPIE